MSPLAEVRRQLSIAGLGDSRVRRLLLNTLGPPEWLALDMAPFCDFDRCCFEEPKALAGFLGQISLALGRALEATCYRS